MILILDDHPLARQGIYSLIQMHKKDVKILQAGTVRESIEIMEKNHINLVFIDINLGKENGFMFLKWIKEKGICTKIFIITSSSRQVDFMRAQELGVDAYVLKDAFIDEIMFGLKTVERGGKFYSAALVEKLNKISADEIALKTLTNREIEVLSHLAKGYSNAKISKILFISEGTTKKHISSILSKLQLYSRADAMLFASKNSYIIQMALDKVLDPTIHKEAQ